jgi:hypothetical protein
MSRDQLKVKKAENYTPSELIKLSGVVPNKDNSYDLSILGLESDDDHESKNSSLRILRQINGICEGEQILHVEDDLDIDDPCTFNLRNNFLHGKQIDCITESYYFNAIEVSKKRFIELSEEENNIIISNLNNFIPIKDIYLIICSYN